MKRKRINWTDEHDQFLKDNWHKMTVWQIKEALGCSWEMVARKGEKLGFERPKSNKWTDEEIEELKKLARDYHYKEIAEILNRPPDGIYLKARRLGISLIQDRRKWTKEEEELLSDYWGKMSIEKAAKKMKRSPMSLKVKAVRLKLGPLIEGDLTFIKINDLMQILDVQSEKITKTWRNKGLIIRNRWMTKKYSYYCVKLSDLLNFLEKNQDLWHSNGLEHNILGEEAEWLKEKRKKDLLNSPYKYRKWSSGELKKVRDLLEMGFNYEEIADRVDRSPQAIIRKVSDIGWGHINRFYWQDEEIEILKNEFLEKTAEELTEKIARSPEAIREKARNLGIKKRFMKVKNL